MPEVNVSDIFRNEELITRALARGVREALIRHKQAGNPVVIWRDGKMVWVKADELLEETKTP